MTFKYLVIVESPAKVKTIEKYLDKRYVVKSSYGHVRDLPKNDSAIDIKNDYQPVYEILKDKKKIIRELSDLSKKVETIWLATDDDREGEAISWHLKEALSLKKGRAKRIVFREITREAVLGAISHPRDINIHLVNSQQARRVLDRLVGFELSPILWKKIKYGLSAGRVQSVAARLVIEREDEIEAFSSDEFIFKTTGTFQNKQKKNIKVELTKFFSTENEVINFLEECKKSAFFVKNIQKKIIQKSPLPPFTTSTLQQEVSRKMNFSVSRIMLLAQKLYEAGYITYMRTDSVILSEEATRSAIQYIQEIHGKQYVQIRQFKNFSKNAQEAHEAIRPTDFRRVAIDMGKDEKKMYELIWRRSMASQMANAQFEKVIITIASEQLAYDFKSTGEIPIFDGFLKIYSLDKEDDLKAQKVLLPSVLAGEFLEIKNIISRQRFSKHPPRYTEANLVKELELKGIGRPSTYAPIISTIQKRNYVLKESREGSERDYIEIVLENGEITSNRKIEITGIEKNKLFPTRIGKVVNCFLNDHFPKVMNYSFTADMEEKFDQIAMGKIKWNLAIDDFYKDFHITIEKTKLAGRISIAQARYLGKDPIDNRPVYVRYGKFGPYVQIGEQTDEDKKNTSLQKYQNEENISLKEALDLFKFPRKLGLFEEQEIIVNVGKYGPYLRHNDLSFSLEKEYDPLIINIDSAIQVILYKRQRKNKRLIKSFNENSDISILNGRWGPYIAFSKKNYKIPKGTDPEGLNIEDCLELIGKYNSKKKER